MYNYEIRVFPKEAEDGTTYWTAIFPSVLGCIGGGDTPEEAVKEAKENLVIYMEFLKSEDVEVALPFDENKHIEYPSMPFDIDDTVYYIEKVSERGGHPGYKIIKFVCCGYYNFGKGWHMRLRKSKYNKFEEYNLPLTDAGYTVFYSKSDIKNRLKDINGFVAED